MPQKTGNIKNFETGRKPAPKKPAAKKPAAKKTAESKLTKAEIAHRNKIAKARAKMELNAIHDEEQKRLVQKRAEDKQLSLQKKQQRDRLRDERSKNRSNKEVREFNPEKLTNEIIGLLFVGVGVFMLMCLLGISTGVAGAFIDQILHGLLGYFSYVLPIASIVGGVFCIIAADRKIELIRMVWFIVGIMFLITLLQVFSYDKFDNTNLSTFIKTTYNKGLDSVGTGALLSMICFYSVLFFGIAGSKWLLSLFFIAAMLIVANISLSKSGKDFSMRLKKYNQEKKEKSRQRAEENMHKNEGTARNLTLVKKSSPTNSVIPKDDDLQDESRQIPIKKQHNSEYFQPSIATPRKPLEQGSRNVSTRYNDEVFSDSGDNDENDELPIITDMPAQKASAGRIPVKDIAIKADFDMTSDDEESIASPVNGNVKPPAYIFPSFDLLTKPKNNPTDNISEEEMLSKAKIIERTLADFGIGGKVIHITHGPVITRYEYAVPSGVKMSKITSLDKELSYSLESSSIRIEPPIPGKAAVGIEVPNKIRSTVYMRELLESDEFMQKESLLSFVVGKDIAGNIVVGDISKMPHTLISGATGSGKSVFINGILLSILFKASPYDVKLIMIDPKKVEFEKYKGIPHLMFPVISDPKKAAGVLGYCVKEMEERYEKMAQVGVRDLKRYNQFYKDHPSDDPDKKPLPLVVIIIDELSDLMVVAGDEVEESIYRLAQMARAAGMYLIIATQRPSVDVVTGVIKANIPSRIALKVASPHDSRTIIDTIGAEQLLGNGDLIYKPQGLEKRLRIQGAWVSDEEVENVVNFIRLQKIRMEQVTQESLEVKLKRIDDSFEQARDTDELLGEAIAFVVKEQMASVSMLQRRFRVGHARAGTLIDEMEKRGVVGPHLGSKPRDVLVTQDEFDIGFTGNDKI